GSSYLILALSGLLMTLQQSVLGTALAPTADVNPQLRWRGANPPRHQGANMIGASTMEKVFKI
ncbi:hypothetical protein MUP32_06605, partial [Candidatus Microgenomates bacterium]|nr:hypothetical protein [Candidatus Microgenomates bacterium]